MKCDRRWWLDGRSALVDYTLFPSQAKEPQPLPEMGAIAYYGFPWTFPGPDDEAVDISELFK